MEVMEVKTMRRAFGFCALFGLVLYAVPAGAAIDEYDTVSPINMTVDSFEYMNAASRDSFAEAMRHWSVAVYEMTKHQCTGLGSAQMGFRPRGGPGTVSLMINYMF